MRTARGIISMSRRRCIRLLLYGPCRRRVRCKRNRRRSTPDMSVGSAPGHCESCMAHVPSVGACGPIVPTAWTVRQTDRQTHVFSTRDMSSRAKDLLGRVCATAPREPCGELHPADYECRCSTERFNGEDIKLTQSLEGRSVRRSTLIELKLFLSGPSPVVYTAL